MQISIIYPKMIFWIDAGLEKIIKINDIITAYRYDASNSMVDYFDTNFYYDINIVALEK